MGRKDSGAKGMPEPLLLLLLCILCGSSMLWLAVGQYPDLVYWGYLRDVEIFMLNILPITILIFFLYAMIGRSWPAYLAGSIFSYVISLCNYYKLFFRDDPLMFEDVLLAREATDMAGTYPLFVDRRVVTAGLCAAAGTVVLYWFSKGERKSLKGRLAIGAVVCAAVMVLCPVYKNSERYSECNNYEALNRNSPTQIYVAHGFWYPFLHSSFQSIESAPEGYSEQQVRDILADYTPFDIPEDKRVDIIAVMREAYIDFSRYDIDGLDCSGYDWYHQLQRESYSGDLYVNVFAGGTVHTEREFLTGNYAVRDFRGDTNSYVWYLREQGYTVEGIHPYHQWFYNRRNVNPYLGFQRYRYYEEDFETMTDAYFPEDVYFYSEIYNDYVQNRGSGNPYFSFNVNVQSHGPYVTADWWGNWGRKEYLTGDQYSTECRYAMNNYMNVIMDSDVQLKVFIEKLKREDRPVVFVMFSDHLPWMGDGNAYYKEMGIDFSEDSEETNRLQYTTEYLIWANDAAKRVLNSGFTGRGPTISPCYLMNLLFKECSWGGGAYMQAMSEIMQTMPVVSTKGSFVVDGDFCNVVPRGHMDTYNRFLYLQYYWRNHFPANEQ